MKQLTSQQKIAVAIISGRLAKHALEMTDLNDLYTLRLSVVQLAEDLKFYDKQLNEWESAK